jgi:hypothetical protein
MVRTPWSSAAIIIPAEQYHSLNVELPFGDPRKIHKILDLEVQDLVPFSVDEFVLQHRTVHANPDGTFDVHVSIMPRERLGTILAACKEGGVEPAIVSTATSVVAALPKLYPSFPRDTVVILHREPYYYVTFLLDGEVRTDRIIDRRVLSNAADSTAAALAELKISIAAIESNYGRRFEKVFLLDTPFTATEASQGLGHPTAMLALPNITVSSDAGSATKGAELAAMSAVFLRDKEPIDPLTNFRTGPFAYSLQLAEVWRGLRLLRPYILATGMAILLALGVIYLLREQRITRLRAAVRDQISSVVPNLTAPEGKENDALIGQTNALDTQLKDLGSPTQSSPLETLLDISRDIPGTLGITVNAIKVKGNRITLETSAPDYAAAEALKSALEKKGSRYCRVKMDPLASAGMAGRRGFRYEVFSCE